MGAKIPESSSVVDDHFQVRESPLKESYDESASTRAIFAAFVAFFAAMFMIAMGYYAARPELFTADVTANLTALHNLPLIIVQWFIVFGAVTFIGFPAAKHHVTSNQSSSWIYFSGVLITVSIIVVVPVYFMVTFEFHNAFKLGIMLEQIRHLTKFVAFLVEKGRRQKVCDNEGDDSDCDEQSEKGEPTMRSFLYFMFAPTMIYRDEYPKAKNPTNWILVASYFAQCVATIFMGFLLIRHFIMPAFSRIGRQPLSADHVVGIILLSVAFSMFIAFAIGYAFLHCWLNMFAEIMNFGDRLFYKNWFMATDMMDFLRLWNYLCHDWIVEYVYKPSLNLTSSKPMAVAVVMILAGIIHDYVISMTGGYVLFYETCFIPLILLTSCWNEWMDRKKAHAKTADKQEILRESHERPLPGVGANISMFLVILFANSIEGIMIFGEYYASQNCPRSSNGLNLLIPRMFVCPSFDLR